MKKLLVLSFLFPFFTVAQQNNLPKLVVGVVVDQMRYDYLQTFYPYFGNKGFKRLLAQGAQCINTQYNYMPTYTGPGHAAIYTGTFPALNGIIANDWYDYVENREIYVTEDAKQHTIGSNTKAGKMSPKNLVASTVTDELYLASNGKSVIAAVSLKDRASILPAGHTKSNVYWVDDSTGNWITSSYYRSQMPTYVVDFNNKKLVNDYLAKNWEPLKNYNLYDDDTPYERAFKGEEKPVFPHVLPEILKATKNKGIIKATPYGNAYTTEFALHLMEQLNMGKNPSTNYPDFMCISYSSTDYVGHQFGTKSIELIDTYVRLDLELEKLFAFLDKQVGKNKYLLFLTADHAAIDNAQYLQDNGVPGGYFNYTNLVKDVNTYLQTELSLPLTEEPVVVYTNQQIYFNNKTLQNLYSIDKSLFVKHNLPDYTSVHDFIATITKNYLLANYKGIANIYNTRFLLNTTTNQLEQIIKNGLFLSRSGSLALNFYPGWMEYSKTGTTHGSPYTYDTHVPLIIMGNGIIPQKIARKIEITDIAPTISLILGINYPNATTGNVIQEIIKK